MPKKSGDLFVSILELCREKAMKSPYFPEVNSPKFFRASEAVVIYACNIFSLAIEKDISFDQIKLGIEKQNFDEVFNHA